MKVLPVSDKLLRLRHWVFVNCYLLREDDVLTLIDTGMSGEAKMIMQEAEKLGLPIVRIVLTHAHVDHVGSLDALHEALPEAAVIISERDARFLSGDMSLDPDEPKDKLRGGYTPCNAKPTQLLYEGDRVGSLEAFATPGHTPGHMSFLDTRDRTAIVGDAFQTLGGVAVSGIVEWRFPLVALATWHKPLCLESARKLLALQPSRLCVGHGGVLEQPAAEMERVIRVMERDLAKEAKAQQHVA